MHRQTFKEPKRARRIREAERLVAKGSRLYARWGERPGCQFLWTDLGGRVHDGLGDWADVFAYRHARARRARDHLAACSCHMCGNPRRHYHALTVQETRAAEDAADQLRAEGLHAASRIRRPGWW